MLNIYNTITRKKEQFIPINENSVGMYVCGPTVYGPPHVGHGRTYINFDIVHRYLKYLGYRVKYVQNITDVGHLVGDSDDGQDKILKQALIEKVDPYEVAYKYETIYFNAMDKLNVLRPSISCRATAFIMDMIDFIEVLIEKGYAYVTEEGNVYFDVSKYAKYGQLTNRKIENSLSGERITIADDKKNPEDFALWKKANPEHIMKWKSPWSIGYPGWHIECSTMSRKFLGDTFDIHGGGLDNIFPHHESEFAQSECCTGKPFVHYFMHNNLITVNGTKMGKSLGNYITLEDLFKEFSPNVIRYFILQFHYRSPVDFNKDALYQSRQQIDKITTAVTNMRKLTDKKAEITDTSLIELKTEYEDAMNEDFNTPLAIATLGKVVKEINKSIESNNIDRLSQLNTIISLLAEDILGLKFDEVAEVKEEISQNIKELAEKRWIAKSNKDWATADTLRNEIDKLGYIIKDSKDGYTIEKK